jgi:hypothetical protein
MTYEVSVNMMFANQSDAVNLCAAVNAIDSTIAAAPVVNGSNWQIAFVAQEAAQATQTSIVSACQTAQSASSVGQIEYHNCTNDSDIQGPCNNQNMASWGGFSYGP